MVLQVKASYRFLNFLKFPYDKMINAQSVFVNFVNSGLRLGDASSFADVFAAVGNWPSLIRFMQQI